MRLRIVFSLVSYETIEWRQDGGVAHITLNRPETVNAWNEEFGRELGDAINERAADPSVRAVLIRGAGKGFSSGADLKGGSMNMADDGKPDILHELHRGLPPDPARRAPAREAGGGGRARRCRGHRLLAGAVLRPDPGRRVVVFHAWRS